MKAFSTMADAVAEAAKTVDEWVILPSEQKVRWDEAIRRAQTLDERNTKDVAGSRFTYLCSDEGAVGITEEKEYLATWILLPALPLPAELEERIRADFEREQKAESAKKSEIAVKFCRGCGKKIRADSEFCRYCGAKLT